MAAEDFDDGRTDVPGGVAVPVERVLVVGAGVAGLTAANALAHAGVECVVLEPGSPSPDPPGRAPCLEQGVVVELPLLPG